MKQCMQTASASGDFPDPLPRFRFPTGCKYLTPQMKIPPALSLPVLVLGRCVLEASLSICGECLTLHERRMHVSQTGARSSNCNESSLCRDIIRLIHYDTCFLVCRSRRVSWYSAADLCQSLNAELTPLLIADIHDALIDGIRTLQDAAAEAEYWIGLHRTRWIWNATGQPQLRCNYIVLTPSMPAVPNCCCSKSSAPYWSNPPFLMFDIRALWRSGLSARAPECQKLKMVG